MSITVIFHHSNIVVQLIQMSGFHSQNNIGSTLIDYFDIGNQVGLDIVDNPINFTDIFNNDVYSITIAILTLQL